MDSVADREVDALLDEVETALDALASRGVVPVDGDDATAALRRLERIGRRVHAVRVGVVGEIDQRRLYRADAHTSAKVHARHACRLSNAEAGRRAKLARALRRLPVLAAGLAAGDVGVDHAQRVAAVFANKRVRDDLIAQDANVARLAATLDYREFDERLGVWERLADEDGAGDRNRRHHDNRTFDLLQEFDGSWRLNGGGASLDGARLRDVLDHFVQAEFEADWAEARARLGDEATTADLARTDAQRRWDALVKVFDQAADAEAARPGGSSIETSIVIDQETFERHLAGLAGEERPPVPDHQHDLAADPAPGAGYRCGTLSGHDLDPTEAVAAALTGHVRRAVLGTDSVVIDHGRRQRLFTGNAHLAAKLQRCTCYWHGCWIRTANTQVDHVKPWQDGGRTDQANAGPLCQFHNRRKQHGYTVHRDPHGTWHIHRPDGTEIS